VAGLLIALEQADGFRSTGLNPSLALFGLVPGIGGTSRGTEDRSYEGYGIAITAPIAAAFAMLFPSLLSRIILSAFHCHSRMARARSARIGARTPGLAPMLPVNRGSLPLSRYRRRHLPGTSPLMRAHFRHIIAIDVDIAAADPVLDHDRLHQRRLADAVAAEHGRGLACAHFERDVPLHLALAIGGAYAAEVEQIGHFARPLGLTPRESDVLLWIANGKSNRDTSEILNISARTMNKHLEQIFIKLGVENRAAAASIATRIIAMQ